MNTSGKTMQMRVYEESHSGWTMRPNEAGGFDIIDANGWALATLHYDYRFTCNATNLSRANLFSASPEMLAALQAVEALVQSVAASKDAVLELVRPAIAKATGSL